MKLRRAGADDRDRLLAWRNRPEIVALGSSLRTVRPDEHDAWYTRVSRDERTRLYIVESDTGEPIGQVRFDPHATGEAVVSIYLIGEHTGRGEGTRALLEATRRAATELEVHRVWGGHPRDQTAASQTSFTRAGYARCPPPEPAELACADHQIYRWEAP